MPPKSAVALAKAGKANRSKITDFFSVPGSVPGPSTTFLDQAPDHKSPAKRQRGVSEDESETLDDRPAKSKRPALAVKADKTSNVQGSYTHWLRSPNGTILPMRNMLIWHAITGCNSTGIYAHYHDVHLRRIRSRTRHQ